jgi:hypothetical protein
MPRDDVALHHLIDALCKLSAESMELAFSNRVSIDSIVLPQNVVICCQDIDNDFIQTS